MARRSKRTISIAILLIVMIISVSTIVVLNIPPGIVSFKKFYKTMKARNLEGISNSSELFLPTYFSKTQDKQFSFRYGYYSVIYQGKSSFSIDLIDLHNASRRYFGESGDGNSGGERPFTIKTNSTCWLKVTGAANFIFVDANLSMMYQYRPISSIETKHEFHLNQTITSLLLNNIAISGQQECSLTFHTEKPIDLTIIDGENHILGSDRKSLSGHMTWADPDGKCVGSILIIQSAELQRLELSISVKEGPKPWQLPSYPYDAVLTSVILVGVIIMCAIILTNVLLYPHISKGNKSKQR